MTPITRRLSVLLIFSMFLLPVYCVHSTMRHGALPQSCPFASQGVTLYVGGGGPGNYSCIQQAIDNASGGDTVFVYDGFYLENILMHTSVHLLGENNVSTIIDGNCAGSVITITADDTIVQGFTIQNAKNEVNYAGIDIIATKNISIIHNIIQNNGGLGLFIRQQGLSQTTIEMNTIRNNSYGVCLRNSPIVIIRANNIYDNGEGIYLIDSPGSQIINNTIMNRGLGLHLEDTYGVGVVGNLIVKNANGAFVFNSSEITFTENVIDWNRWYGLWLKDTTLSSIDRNTISNNIDVGLFLESSYDMNVVNNTLWDNDNGIYLKDSSGNTFQNNYLRNDKMNACFVSHTLINRRNLWQLNYWERARMFPYPIFGVIKLEKLWINSINFDWKPLRQPPQSNEIIQGCRYTSILYVGGNGPNNYSSIQQAINDAQGNDTIYVFHGTYYEMILINKSLQLVGENKTTTILEGNGTRDIITIIADYVTITGFTIQNGHFNVLVNHSSYGSITGNNIDSGLHGVSVQNGCHFLTISKNSIQENVYGIRLFSSTDMAISKNILKSYKINAFYFGTTIAHGRHHWYNNYWGASRYLPYIIVGKIRVGNFSLTWLNFDWFPLRNPYEEAPIDIYKYDD